MDDEEKLRQAKEVLGKILGEGGKPFSIGNILGGTNIKTGGLLGGLTSQQRGAVTSIPPRTSTGRRPRDKRPPKRPIRDDWQPKTKAPKEKKPEEKIDLETFKEWAIKELAHLFELQKGKVDIKRKKDWLFSLIPESFIEEIIKKAQQLAKKAK